MCVCVRARVCVCVYMHVCVRTFDFCYAPPPFDSWLGMLKSGPHCPAD